jgi:hypothetical protein
MKHPSPWFITVGSNKRGQETKGEPGLTRRCGLPGSRGWSGC